MCERIVQKASLTEAPQPNVLLEELISATEKVKATSSALLIDAKKSLNQLQEMNPTPGVSKVNDFVPISKDPGNRREILTDEDREFMINLGPFQPKLGSYPRNNEIPQSKQCRFSSEWFHEFPHLEYSVVKDAAFCFVCQLFPTGVGHEKSSDAWTVEGVCQWHKMKGRGKSKQGKLSSHFASSSHKASLDALAAFQRKLQHIDNIMDKEQMKLCIEAEAEKQRNREAIKILIDIARVLARQGLSLRGHGSESDANGNFHQLVLLVARHSPSLRRWLDEAEKRPQRATYLNWHSQNEFLELLSDYVNEKVKSEVETAQFISVMADTTPDASHLDQLSVVLRYVTPSGAMHERLVDMHDIDKKTGDGQALAILTSLRKKEFNTETIVFQSYDYTSSMSGKFKGCQAKMSEYLEREIPYFPCLAHRINTTVEHSCKSSSVIAAMFDTLEMIYVFLTSSTKRYMAFQQVLKDKDIEGALTLRNLSVTRWVARSDSITAVWASFEGIVSALEKEMESSDAKTKIKAKNLLGKVRSFEFIVALMFMRNVMSKTKILTKQVQAVDLNIVDALEALDATINTLKYLRMKEDDVNLQIDAAIAFSAQHGIDAQSEFAKHHRKRIAPRRIDDAPENAIHPELATFYRKEFLQVLDAQISLLDDNLKVAFKIIEPAVSLLKPPYESEMVASDVASLTQLFPTSFKPDESSLEVELNVFRNNCSLSKPDITSIPDAFNYCLKYKNIFPLTLRCFKLTLTAPVTSASSERSFSKLKLIKTLIRSTMRQERLQNLMTLACEKDLTDQIDLEHIVTKWSKLPKSGRVIRL